MGLGAPNLVNPDTVVLKLAPGEKVEFRMLAVRGIGSQHAKFSVVAPALLSIRFQNQHA